jgi:hypothetical protein
MEAVRPQVDAFLLDWITRQPLKREWFFEQRDGNCRLMASLAARLGWPPPARTCVLQIACRRLSWASGVRFSIARGTVKFVAQYVQRATAGTVPSRWTILRLRFCVVDLDFVIPNSFLLTFPHASGRTQVEVRPFPCKIILRRMLSG